MHRADADQQEHSSAPARSCVPWHSSVFWEERWPCGLHCSGLWVCDPGNRDYVRVSPMSGVLQKGVSGKMGQFSLVLVPEVVAFLA